MIEVLNTTQNSVNLSDNQEINKQDINQKSKSRYILKKIVRIFRFLVIFFFASTVLSVILYSFIPVYITPLMIIRSTEKIIEGKKPKISKYWVNLSEMSRHLPNAVIAGEDQNFVVHSGFDFEAMRMAYERNKKGKKVYGASTISQQTAKNVFLFPARNYLRKGLEAYFTMLIELFWSKRRIMEVYLNVVETGDGIYGVEAAARYYFKKSAKNLSKEEAAAIAASLPNPRKYNHFKQTNFYTKHKAFILKYMDYIEPFIIK